MEPETTSRLGRLERQLGAPGFAARLAALATADLTAVQLAVADTRADARGAKGVTDAWCRGGYVAPMDGDARALRRLELALLDEARAFEALELSPLAPLGACSTFSLGSQNRVLPTARSFEVMADPTNVLALECARRRRQQHDPIRLCAAARCVRTQPLLDPSHSRHFSMFCAVTAERDKDSRAFAARAVGEHVSLHIRLHQAIVAARAAGGYGDADRDAPAVALQLLATDGYAKAAEQVARGVSALLPAGRDAITIGALEQPYYAGLRFVLSIELAGTRLPISDGGVFDWLRTLCSDRKEQLACSGIGSELGVRVR